MRNKRNSLLLFVENFNSNSVCRTYLQSKRWRNGIYCPHCLSNRKIYKFKDEVTLKCSRCRRKFTSIIGTFFENTNIELHRWFLAIYLMCSSKKGINSIQLSNYLGLSQKTCWFILHRVRFAMTEAFDSNLNGIVEMDETYVGGKTKNKHKKQRYELNKNGTGYVNMHPVFGMLERGGRLRLLYTGGHKVDGNILKPIIYNHISKDSTVITDGFGGYSGLAKNYRDHQVLNHNKQEFVRGEHHTNSIENVWSILKRTLTGNYHSFNPKHLQSYCNEVQFRYNTRHLSDMERFDLLLSQCQGRLKYKDLIKEKQIKLF